MKKLCSILFLLGYLVVVVGVALRVFSVIPLCRYVLLGGVVVATVCRLLSLPKSDDRQLRRLNMQQLFSALFQCLGTYMVWVGGYTSWILPFLISALVDLWLTMAYGRRRHKE
ncbi:MAG: hypothetical protein Q4D14_00020 [Bacteroidales bacterium]|nr:hypothetical protein [Bacteroidales bacterium]